MYLRDLAVCSTWHYVEPDTNRLHFNWSTHIVVETVLAWIPRNTVVLDNIAKLNISVGDPKGLECSYDKWQGIGTYYVAEFDFINYSKLEELNQQEIILKLLHSAFTHVSQTSRGDAFACFEALKKVKSFGLPLPKLGSDAFWEIMPAQKRRSKSFKENINFLVGILENH